MRGWTLLAAALLLWAPLASGQEEAESEETRLRRVVSSRCAARWSQNLRLRERCVEKQIDASQKLTELNQRYPRGTEESGVILDCVERWIGERGTKADFLMALTCAEIGIGATPSAR